MKTPPPEFPIPRWRNDHPFGKLRADEREIRIQSGRGFIEHMQDAVSEHYQSIAFRNWLVRRLRGLE